MLKKSKTPQRLFGCESLTEVSTPSLREPDLGEMEFGEEDYTLVLYSLLEAIGESNYFSGNIHTTHGDFDSRLTLTIIIYRDGSHPTSPISDIVPVWWQMQTFVGEERGEESLNDFSFRTLREHLLASLHDHRY